MSRGSRAVGAVGAGGSFTIGSFRQRRKQSVCQTCTPIVSCCIVPERTNLVTGGEKQKATLQFGAVSRKRCGARKLDYEYSIPHNLRSSPPEPVASETAVLFRQERNCRFLLSVTVFLLGIGLFDVACLSINCLLAAFSLVFSWGSALTARLTDHGSRAYTAFNS